MIFSFKSTSKLLGFILLSILFIVSSIFAATPDSLSPLLSLVRKNYSPETSLSAKFSQTIYWNVREKEEKRKGRICLAPGDKFRVTIDKETIVSNGETFWQYSAGANQVVMKKIADVDRSALPSQIFARYLLAYPFREVERKKNIVQFSGKSDSAGAPYKEIRLWVRETGGQLTRCVLIDRNDNTFTYAFTAMVFGKNLPRETFEFDVPKNARIVDMRK